MEIPEPASWARGQSQRCSTPTGVGSCIGAVSWTLTILTLLAFGGGLFLAFFSFNTSESPKGVAARAPEVLYRPPSVSPVIDETQTEAVGSAESGMSLALA